jgi:hypothetical protein
MALGMTYDDAMDEETTVTRAQALREVRRHHGDEAAFLVECGDHAEYSSRAVLLWLGY